MSRPRGSSMAAWKSTTSTRATNVTVARPDAGWWARCRSWRRFMFPRTEGPHPTCFGALPVIQNKMEDILATRMLLSLILVSEGLNCLIVAGESGAARGRKVTGCGKASVDNAKFRAGNTLQSNVRTALSSSYYGVGFARYASRCNMEVQF